MSLNEYKISAELKGHSLDVRVVINAQDSIVSGSRDKTVKIWNEEGNTYINSYTLANHSNFVSSLCFLENDLLLCTGSNDSTICVYLLGDRIPVTTLHGHTSTVCSLAPALEDKMLISGSWDKTARIWNINSLGPSTSITLLGHEAAVWAVTTLKQTNQYLTGSADKTIIIWNSKGSKIRVIKGHSDCVRGIVTLPNGNFASCGNDAVIKYWTSGGEIINEFFGHTNYIYTIAENKLLGDDMVISGGEDCTVRLWNLKTGPIGDALTLPAQSVWSVVCLKNGDIVTGTSDGIVRVFTRDPTRFANIELQTAFNESVNARILASSQHIGGMKVNELPGPEKLLVAGREGQTTIIRHPDGKIQCHKYANGEWTCLGDVTGAAEENVGDNVSTVTTGKTLYEGKEYDHVFSIDISESSPALKLPYNCDEDPWVVAQKFIHTHNLPQAYLEQVANFIIKNSSRSSIRSSTNTFQDPFTGSSRYIPGSSMNVSSATTNSNINADPFTGESSYSTGKTQSSAIHFPSKEYFILDICQPAKIIDKIRKFNEKVDSIYKVNENDFTDIIKLCNNSTSDITTINNFKRLLQWPNDVLFPILDITRMALRYESIAKKLMSNELLSLIFETINQPPANQIMSIRCLANLMNHSFGRDLISAEIVKIIDAMSRITEGTGNLQITVATLYLNITVAQLQLANQDLCRVVTESILNNLQWTTDAEALYRYYTALGNLTCTPFGHITIAQISSIDKVVEKINHDMGAIHAQGFIKLNDVARDLKAAL